MSNEINFVSQFIDNLGIPIHAREFYLALEKKIKVNKIQLNGPLKDFNKKCKTLTFWYPNLYSSFATDIGMFVFEYNKIPKSFVEEINNLTCICTPSKWGKKILENNNVDIPIYVIPGGVDSIKFNKNNRNLSVDYFKFLHIGKAEARKGTKLLIESFNEAFKGDKKITLTLSIDNPHLHDFNSENYLKSINLKYPISNINIIHYVDDIRTLYDSHHVAIFPTMAEGIGLPIVEAISSSLPTIVSYNTGITEYANDENCILLKKLKKIPIYDSHFFPNSGEFGEWDSPQKEELIEKMLWVYENYDKAKLIGEYGERWMKENFSWDKSADIFIKEVLNG